MVSSYTYFTIYETYLFVALSPFNFAPVLGLSPSELHSLHFAPTIRRVLVASAEDASHLEDYPYTMCVIYFLSDTSDFL